MTLAGAQSESGSEVELDVTQATVDGLGEFVPVTEPQACLVSN